MTILRFHQSLVDLLRDVAESGGDPIQATLAPSKLVTELRQLAMQEFQRSERGSDSRFEFFLAEEVANGGFREAVTSCLIYIRGLGIETPTEQRRVLSLVVRAYALANFDADLDRTTELDARDQALIRTLLELWVDQSSEDVLLYQIARRRFLIAWNGDGQRWTLTNLGHMAIRLPPAQLVVCLLLADLLLAGDQDLHHLSAQGVDRLLEQGRSEFLRMPQVPVLEQMGVVRRVDAGEEAAPRHEVTPVGRTLLEQVRDENHPLRRTVQAMLESDERGEQFIGRDDAARELVDALQALGSRDLADSCANALGLFGRRSYLDAAKLLFPVIESLANRLLKRAGADPSDQKLFPGLSAKVLRLEREGVIPADLSTALSIVTSRNKVLHGEFSPVEQEYAYPLCLAAMVYLRRMTHEVRKANPPTARDGEDAPAHVGVSGMEAQDR